MMNPRFRLLLQECYHSASRRHDRVAEQCDREIHNGFQKGRRQHLTASRGWQE